MRGASSLAGPQPCTMPVDLFIHSQAVFERYLGGVALSEPAAGTMSLAEAMRSLNKYPTTLHAINSAVVKLGKLTRVSKVFRGISGKALPSDFWVPNQFGVKGGVENAFMSCTVERSIAQGYASGDGTTMGVVIEVQQGMVNRGADLSWLSQYPHEQEILFGPLTGIEVRRTRIDGGLVVIECDFNVNLTALTVEQVLSKRRKVVLDMCEQLAFKARQEAQSEAWWLLRASKISDPAQSSDSVHIASVIPEVEAYITQRLMPVAQKESAHYNENTPLGDAIKEAVMIADILSGWPEELQSLVEFAGKVRRELGQQMESACFDFTEVSHISLPVHRKNGRLGLNFLRRQVAWPQDLLVVGNDLADTNALLQARLQVGDEIVGVDGVPLQSRARLVDIIDVAKPVHQLQVRRRFLRSQQEAQLVNDERIDVQMRVKALLRLDGPLSISLTRQGSLPQSSVHGLCALMWLRPHGVPLHLNLSVSVVLAEGLAMLARSISPSVASLRLSGSNVANNGGDNTGLQLLCKALSDPDMAGCLTVLSLQDNRLNFHAAALVAESLRVNTVLQNVDLRGNNFAAEGWCVIFEALRDNPENKIESWDLSSQGLNGAVVRALAAYVATSKTLAALMLDRNKHIRDAGAFALADALKTNTSLKVLDLSICDVKTPGAVALGDALCVNSSLRSLRLKANAIEAKGSGAIAQALSSNSTLRSLDLEGDPFSHGLGPEGAALMAASLTVNSTLRYLSLSNNHLYMEGGLAIAEALLHNSTLEHIELGLNHLHEKLGAGKSTFEVLGVMIRGGDYAAKGGEGSVVKALGRVQERRPALQITGLGSDEQSDSSPSASSPPSLAWTESRGSVHYETNPPVGPPPGSPPTRSPQRRSLGPAWGADVSPNSRGSCFSAQI